VEDETRRRRAGTHVRDRVTTEAAAVVVVDEVVGVVERTRRRRRRAAASVCTSDNRRCVFSRASLSHIADKKCRRPNYPSTPSPNSPIG